MDREKVLGTIAVSKMMGGTFRIRHDKCSDPAFRDIYVDLIEDKHVVWRYLIAKHVRHTPRFGRKDLYVKDFYNDARLIYYKAVNGDEATYLQGRLTNEAK